MIKDAEKNLRNARYSVSKAEEYFEKTNKHFILEWLRIDNKPKQKTLDRDDQFKEHVTNLINIFLNPQRYVNDIDEKEEPKRKIADTFEASIQTSSMILSYLNHRDRLRYFREAIRNDLATVNDKWFDRIIDRHYSWNPFK